MKNTITVLVLVGVFMLSTSTAVAQQHISSDSIDVMMRKIPDEVFEHLQSGNRHTQPKSKTFEEKGAQVYTIPSGSNDNIIQLSIFNTTDRDMVDLEASIEGLPAWLRMNIKNQKISKLSPRGIATVSFRFDMVTEVPGQKTANMTLMVVGKEYTSIKNIEVVSGRPLQFELDQNYPNPFNPATTIQYRLPQQMKVTVNVYNILGRKIITLADGLQQAAGQQTLRFDGSRFASGVYFFRVIAQADGGRKFIQIKKMTLIK